ncbi:MAG: quercetin 2,3-dioxygenase [Mycobacterium sp.]|nr:quercetin 2,3-dioxygenase [Mycobacterium sp.]
MSNLEAAPVEETGSASPQQGVEVLRAREVPLGGPRAMRVRRTLPQRQRSLIGAWCFADHYGPRDVTRSSGMVVPPHPHTGLQTVSWLFSGEIEHRDSGGVHAYVRPGELNLMTAGAGICHSEVSTAAARVLHGVQLWVALPDTARDTQRSFDHYVPQAIPVKGGSLRVFLGALEGAHSPVHTFSPLVGAQLDIDPNADVTLTVNPKFEHGVLLDQGAVSVRDSPLEAGDLACQAAGSTELRISNTEAQPARVLVLGGTPFTAEILMWWNFVARSHEEIVSYRGLWESEDSRFGAVLGYDGFPARLSAPPLPTTRLKPRPAPGGMEA